MHVEECGGYLKQILSGKTIWIIVSRVRKLESEETYVENGLR